MADNTLLNSGAGGDTMRSVDYSGVKTPVTKLCIGSGAESLVVGLSTNPSAAQVAIPVRTAGDGFMSTLNSSTAVLGAGATFTGSSEDVTQYSTISIFVIASHASATDGLVIEQSVNGTNWDNSDTYTISANSGKTISVAAISNFFRIRYINGGTLQTSFRLSVKLHKSYMKPSSVKPQDARGNDNDMEEQISYQCNFNGSTWDRSRTSAKGVQPDNGQYAPVQAAKDSGRTPVTFTASNVTAPASGAAALISLTRQAGVAAGSAATTHLLTNGKRLRITNIIVSTRGHNTATAQQCIFHLRTNAGAVATGSTAVITLRSGTPSQSLGWDRCAMDLTDGYEFLGDGTQQIGMTITPTFTTNAPTYDVTIIGYEY